MGSVDIVRDVRGISTRSKPWERIYGPFPSVIPYGGIVSMPNIGEQYREGKEEEPKTT